MSSAGEYAARLIRSVTTALCFALPSSAFAASAPAIMAPGGMVVTSHQLASAVGAKILGEGGNAVDAAVAVGYALAVVDPCCGNIGGGGFATIRMADGTAVVVDFRETAPGAASEDMYLDAKGEIIPRITRDGYMAVGVPGTVLGLDTMLRRFGTLPRQRVMAPAIALAENGYTLSGRDADFLASFAKTFAMEPNVAAIFLNDGRSWREGERFIQKQLGATLRTIAADGPGAFYEGPIADAIAAASLANGGLLSKQDLAAYRVVERPPLTCSYRGFQLIVPPPPGSGGIAL